MSITETVAARVREWVGAWPAAPDAGALLRVLRFLGQWRSTMLANTFLRHHGPVVWSGPFEGIQGKLLRCDGKLRLVVEVIFLRQGVSLEVEPWMVRPVEGNGLNRKREPALAGGRQTPEERRCDARRSRP